MTFRPEPKAHASVTQKFADERRRQGTKAEMELERILNMLSAGKLRGRFQREWAYGGRWIVDFYFPEVRLGIEVDGGYHTPIVQQLRDVERELAIEKAGITLIRITNEEVFGDRNFLLEKLRDGWRRALVQIRAKTAPRRQRPIPPAPTRRRKMAKATHYSGGWTSIEQGATMLGDSSEKAYRFASWLNTNGLGYVYISQSIETFATLFHGETKRPDFLVLLDSIGILAVDVKNYKASGGVLTLSWDAEITKVLTFERIFRLPVWYAYLQEEEAGETWYWISALKAVEVGERRTNEKRGEVFLAIELEHFETIRSGEDLGKLFTHRLPGLAKIRSATAS